jgi:hypothetical protein
MMPSFERHHHNSNKESIDLEPALEKAGRRPTRLMLKRMRLG